MDRQIETMKNSKRIEELEQDKQALNKYVNTLYSIVDKLEQRISTLEKAESKKEESKQLAFPFPDEFLNFRVIKSK